MGKLRRWLAEVGLESLAETLEAHDIDIDILGELSEAELGAIGISLGQRKRLLRAYAARQAESAEPAAPERAKGEAERRQMTIVFCDMVGSSALAARLDPEDMFIVVAAYQRCCMEVIKEHGGYVAQYLGDGVLAYFGFPVALEDDAERAVRAGLALVEAVRRLRPRPDINLHARVGIDTGLVVIGDLLAAGIGNDDSVVGDTPNFAARLQAMAPTDGVVISDNTKRLLGNLFTFEGLQPPALKGFPTPAGVWQVTGEGKGEGRFEVRSAAGLTPMIGREHELSLMLERWRVARAGEGQVMLLTGEGGIGKSRLIDTLNREIVDDPHIRLRYFCSQFYASTALYPIIEQIRRAAGFTRQDDAQTQLDRLERLLDEEDDPQRSAALFATLCSVPLGDRYPPQEMSPVERKQATFELLLRQADRLARRLPLLIMFEDAHWIDSTSAELLGLFIDRVRRLPALLIVTSRPEFSPPWNRQPHLTSLQLGRFSRQQAVDLIDRVTGGRRLPAEVVQLILDKTDGVPLFVEELTKALMETGALTLRGDAYALTGPLPTISIPSTLHDSLMARLDRLATVKEVALWASALGRSFTLEQLAAVAPLDRVEIERALARLVDAEMVYRHGLWGDQVFEFKHALVQEAAYLSMLRIRRQQMHARIGQVLEESFPDTAANQPEILAHHYGEGGVTDKAYDYNLKAGDAAAARYASPEARTRYARALSFARQLPPAPRAQRRELKAILKCASVAFGKAQIEADLRELQHAEAIAEGLGHEPRLAQVHYWMGRLDYVAGRFDSAVAHAAESLSIADRLADERQSASAANLLARIHCLRGEPAKGIAYAQRNVEQMRQVGNRIEEAAITGVLAVALALAARFAEAQAAGERACLLSERLDHLPTRAACLFFKGVAHGWQGDIEVAEPCFAEAMAMADKSGDAFRRYVIHGWRGEALLHVGEDRRAERDLAACQEMAERIGSEFHRGGFMALRAEALLRAGHVEEALRLSDRALELAERSQQSWSLSLALRSHALADVAADAARAGDALAALRRAAHIQADQDLVCDLGWTGLATAHVLAAAADHAGAAREAAAAHAMFRDAGIRYVPLA